MIPHDAARAAVSVTAGEPDAQQTLRRGTR
jgi:hypothetical protein